MRAFIALPNSKTIAEGDNSFIAKVGPSLHWKEHMNFDVETVTEVGRY